MPRNPEADMLAQELETLLEEFREILGKIKDFNTDDRKAKLHQCAQISQQVRTIREAFILELKSMEGEDRQCYQKILKERLQRFKAYLVEYENKKTEIDRYTLHAEAEEVEDNTEHVMTVQQMAQQGDRVQDMTQESVSRAKQMMLDAEQIGLETAEKMEQQTIQMGRVDEGLNDVEHNVKRAKKTMQSIARSAASDRCMQILCGGIVVCIIIIIVLSTLK